MHDVTKSTNPDIRALVEMNRQLGMAVLRLVDELAAIRGELDALPKEYVVPGPQGQVPAGYALHSNRATVKCSTGLFEEPGEAPLDLG